MDIEGLGPAVLEQLMDAGLITHVYDLYHLDPDAVAALDRMGDKSAENLLAALEKSKEAGLDRVLFSLGIRHIGQKAAKLLAGRFGIMNAVMEASLDDINAIDGFGRSWRGAWSAFSSWSHPGKWWRSWRGRGVGWWTTASGRTTALPA